MGLGLGLGIMDGSFSPNGSVLSNGSTMREMLLGLPRDNNLTHAHTSPSARGDRASISTGVRSEYASEIGSGMGLERGLDSGTGLEANARVSSASVLVDLMGEPQADNSLDALPLLPLPTPTPPQLPPVLPQLLSSSSSSSSSLSPSRQKSCLDPDSNNDHATAVKKKPRTEASPQPQSQPQSQSQSQSQLHPQSQPQSLLQPHHTTDNHLAAASVAMVEGNGSIDGSDYDPTVEYWVDSADAGAGVSTSVSNGTGAGAGTSGNAVTKRLSRHHTQMSIVADDDGDDDDERAEGSGLNHGYSGAPFDSTPRIPSNTHRSSSNGSGSGSGSENIVIDEIR